MKKDRNKNIAAKKDKEDFPMEIFESIIQDERKVMSQKIGSCDREDPEGDVVEDAKMYQDDITQEKHSYEVLVAWEEELRFLEEWLMDPKTCEDHIEVGKENESKEDFQIPSNGRESELSGNILK